MLNDEQGEGLVMGMACDASGGLLATAGADSKVHVWDVDGGFCTHFFKGHKGVVRSVLFHPDATKNIVSTNELYFRCKETTFLLYRGMTFLLCLMTRFAFIFFF